MNRFSRQEATWIVHSDWAGFPILRDVLPPSLIALDLEMSGEIFAPPVLDCSDYESVLSSALSSPEGPKSLLKSIELRFKDIYGHGPLPLNFWSVQKHYHGSGIRFNYHLDCDSSKSTYTFLNHTLEWAPTETYGHLHSISMFAISS